MDTKATEDGNGCAAVQTTILETVRFIVLMRCTAADSFQNLQDLMGRCSDGRVLYGWNYVSGLVAGVDSMEDSKEGIMHGNAV